MKWLLRATICAAAVGTVCGLYCAIAQGVLTDSAGWMAYGFGITTVNGCLLAFNVRNYRRSYGSNRRAEARHQNSEADDGATGSARALARASRGSGPDSSVEMETVKQAEPIRAWRGLRLVADDSTVGMFSVNYGGQFVADEAHARCAANDYGMSIHGSHHSAPGPLCRCGFYGVKSITDCIGNVVAEVDLYGTIIEHEAGYRAEYQRVLSVWVFRSHCQGGFLCGAPVEMVAFPPDAEVKDYGMNGSSHTVVQAVPAVLVCRTHAINYQRSATLQQIAARLGVEVRWHDGIEVAATKALAQ